MSGQVYTERPFIRTARSTSGTTWIHETPFLPLEWEESNDIGAPSLKHSAMKMTLSDQRILTPQHFENISWPIASYIWDFLGRSGKRTLYMWKLFATAYPLEFREVARYRSIKIVGPRASIREYLGMAKSDRLIWRVMLTLRVMFAKVPELVEISEIRNIVALEISTPIHSEPVFEETETPVMALSDRILRTWSELAQTAGAFAHLRVMVLKRQTDLSGVALRYLREITSLQFVVVHECPSLTSIFPPGRSEVNGWKVVEELKVPPESLYEFYQTSLNDKDGPSDEADLSKLVQSPILDFQIGQRTISLLSQNTANDKSTHSTIYLQRSEAPERVDPEPEVKKRKVVQAGEGVSQPSIRNRRPVMRNRKGKELGDVLKDFL